MTYTETLKEAIWRMHGCDSKHLESVQVTEYSIGKIVWDGTVEVFRLLGPMAPARRCYAWIANHDGPPQVIALLEKAPVRSPRSAVHATVVAGLDTKPRSPSRTTGLIRKRPRKSEDA
ncbi:MAG: hypothetical protein JO317_03685 [Verrucomicrobiae bacterium]|nr:hypothetical protein [Verrucomicrobiae bacterium]